MVHGLMSNGLPYFRECLSLHPSVSSNLGFLPLGCGGLSVLLSHNGSVQ